MEYMASKMDDQITGAELDREAMVREIEHLKSQLLAEREAAAKDREDAERYRWLPMDTCPIGEPVLTRMKHGVISGVWDGNTAFGYYWRHMEWYPYNWMPLPAPPVALAMTGTDFKIEQLKATIEAQEQKIAALAHGEVSLLSFLYDIRKAAGDPKGKLMQEELVARIAGLKAGNDAARGVPERLRDRAKVSVLHGHHSSEWANGVRFAANELEQALGKGEK